MPIHTSRNCPATGRFLPQLDLEGRRFGKLVVLRYEAGKWACVCDCGNETRGTGTELRQGMKKSCGCLWRRGSPTHGMTNTTEHAIWCQIRGRCLSPRNTVYRYYGGRGITICPEWSDFTRFYADMGPRPGLEYSIERKDNNGPYAPWNCRWATDTEQGRNRRSNVLMTHQGRTQTLTEWALEVGISVGTLWQRVKVLHWSDEEAITRPVGPNGPKRLRSSSETPG